MNALLLHKLRYISQRLFLWPLIAIIVLIASSCSDTGTLAAVEDARELADGNLANGLFVHSLLQIDKMVYVGSKFVWERNPSKDWSKTTLPSGLDPNETPVVSIATNNKKDLFLATNKYIYVRLRKNSDWSSKTFSPTGSGTFSFNSLYAAGSEVLAVNSKNAVYRYMDTDDTWETVATLKNTPIRGFAESSNKFFIAYRNKIKSGNNLNSLKDLSGLLPNGKNNIQDILSWSSGDKNYLGMVAADSKLYIYDIAENKWNEYKGGREFSNYKNLSLAKIDNNSLIVGRQQNGYQIFDLKQLKWKEDSYSKDNFTDSKSLVTLSSGVSITALSLYKFLFYDDPNDVHDRIYAVPYSSHGVFGAKRKGSRWTWSLE